MKEINCEFIKSCNTGRIGIVLLIMKEMFPLFKVSRIFIKTEKKCLTKGDGFGILAKLAYGRPKESTANLENDTEEVTRNTGKISEDSKELSIERCLRIKRKSLILAQDERWRRA